jgi:hypothetical protein
MEILYNISTSVNKRRRAGFRWNEGILCSLRVVTARYQIQHCNIYTNPKTRGPVFYCTVLLYCTEVYSLLYCTLVLYRSVLSTVLYSCTVPKCTICCTVPTSTVLRLSKAVLRLSTRKYGMSIYTRQYIHASVYTRQLSNNIYAQGAPARTTGPLATCAEVTN